MAAYSHSAATKQETDDGRELTLAGKDHQVPEFPLSSKCGISGRNKSSRTVPRPFSTPVAPISLEELDLSESTLVGESFVSSGSVSITINSGGSTSNSNNVQSVAASNSEVRSRKYSVLHRLSLLGQSLRSSTASQPVEEIDLTSAKVMKRELLRLEENPKLDINDLLFTIMEKKYRKDVKKPKLLMTLLTYSNVNINQRAPSGMTPLHIAIQDHDIKSAEILVAFGANLNATNQLGKTPLDLLQSDIEESISSSSFIPNKHSVSPEHSPTKSRHWSTHQSKRLARLKCIEFLQSMGALRGELAYQISSIPKVPSFPQVPSSSPSISRSQKSNMEILDWEAQLTSHYSELERNIKSRLQNTSPAGQKAMYSPDMAISFVTQLQEMSLFQKAGCRILCLDGGGIRGLIQIEILSQLEVKTGRRIIELFDWIVGTSTGGVIALGLVYAKKTLSELRQLYFRLKDEVFGKTKGGVSFNTAGLEKILKEEFTETRCMDDETYPRVLVSAVKKDHINLKLHFFNNCFNDGYCKHCPVWKVARYTSAAPVLFGEADGYVDGGLLANNPSDSGLTRIQSFYRSRGEKLPLSMVVSVGCGKYPSQTIGNVDFLFVGGQGWSSLTGTSNLMTLLSYALVEPSIADSNCKSRCEEQGVRYFRLNPRLEEVIGSGETDTETLIAAILQTRKEMTSRPEFANLVLCFHELSDASRKMHTQLNGDESSDNSTLLTT